MLATVRLMTRPMTTTLLSVPSPGRWRSGSQTARTQAPTMIDHVPTASPNCLRQSLVEDVPGIDAEAADQEQAVTEAVQGEPEVELAESSETGRPQHQASVTRMAWL